MQYCKWYYYYYPMVHDKYFISASGTETLFFQMFHDVFFFLFFFSEWRPYVCDCALAT